MNNLQEVVRYVRSALDNHSVFVHMTAPQLETLLAGLEELQNRVDELEDENAQLKHFKHETKAAKDNLIFATGMYRVEITKLRAHISTLTKEEPA